MEITFDITKLPSRSKGWAQIKAVAAGEAVISSSTGNEWVSSSKNADVVLGTHITVTVRMSLKHGKGRTERTELTSRDYQLIAEHGATAELGGFADYYCVEVAGARLAQ